MAGAGLVFSIACIMAAFLGGMFARGIAHSYYMRLVRVMYSDHREEWLREGKPEHLVLGDSLTGGYRASQYLFGKWLYSPPGWVSASEPLRRAHERMRLWKRISDRVFVVLFVLGVTGAGSIVTYVYLSQSGGAEGSPPASGRTVAPVGAVQE